ncbi:MAG: hypothetical protein L0H79_08260 [Intrasporangium sp.]|uniref:hypothetical protein n=1 Tax=Intrasporangium sp. TaxID=1925024 RepID=UPI002647F520|nr:hypothetical protein [Intrasporangium sp.]MDN5795730.1 hypothetical protein [Intrasporangium sp.]
MKNYDIAEDRISLRAEARESAATWADGMLTEEAVDELAEALFEARWDAWDALATDYPDVDDEDQQAQRHEQVAIRGEAFDLEAWMTDAQERGILPREG